MDFDATELRQIGTRHKRLRKDLDEIRPRLATLIRAAHEAGMPQVDIAEVSGYTRDQVRQICLPPERRRVRAARANS